MAQRAQHPNAFRTTLRSLSDDPSATAIPVRVQRKSPDAFEQRMRQYELDRERLKKAVHTTQPVMAFRKARPLPGVAARLEQSEAAADALGVSDNESLDGKPAAAGVLQSTPPNVSRQWASKGKQRNVFLRRIHSDGPIDRSPPGVEGDNLDDPDIIFPRKTAYTGDSPCSSVDWTAAAADIPLASTEQATVENDSPSKRRSSPSFTFRRRASARQSSLDNILELDPARLEQAENFAASTESSRAKRQSLRQKEIDDLRKEGITTKERTALESSIPVLLAESGSSKSSVVAFKSAKASGIPRSEALRNRLGHKRQSSRDLLKQLARASSTPSPTRRSDARIPLTSSSPRKSPIALMNGSKRGNVAAGDHRLLTPPEDEVSRNPPDLEPKTPVVTGAWLDTPRNKEAAADAALPETPPPETMERPAQAENGPKSALEAVLRSSSSDAGMGDSTIASLRGLLGQDDTVGVPLGGVTTDLANDAVRQGEQREGLRQEEKDLVNRMGGLLQTARVGVRDASRGLRRVEKHVEETGGRGLVSTQACESCGCPGRVTLGGLLADSVSSFRKNFYTWSGKGLHLTWLGLFSAILLSWYMTEVALCEYYCHPLYATTMIGYGVDINAPRMPYVATTILLKRPFGRLFRPFLLFWRNLIVHCLRSFGLLEHGFEGGADYEAVYGRDWP